MAARVLSDASVPSEERHARTLAEWIMRERSERANVSVVRDGAWLPGLRETDAVKGACRFLADAGRLTVAEDTGNSRRPRGDWVVNTLLWKASP